MTAAIPISNIIDQMQGKPTIIAIGQFFITHGVFWYPTLSKHILYYQSHGGCVMFYAALWWQQPSVNVSDFGMCCLETWLLQFEDASDKQFGHQNKRFSRHWKRINKHHPLQQQSISQKGLALARQKRNSIPTVSLTDVKDTVTVHCLAVRLRCAEWLYNGKGYQAFNLPVHFSNKCSTGHLIFQHHFPKRCFFYNVLFKQKHFRKGTGDWRTW
jgi:hypothetical protein